MEKLAQTKAGTGGIAGLQKGNNALTKYCYNKNRVTSHSNIAGIIGDLNTGTVENCYNIGQIKSYQSVNVVNVGGICGRTLSGTQVKNSYTLDSLNLAVVGLPAGNTVDTLSSQKTEHDMKDGAFLTIINSGENKFKKLSGFPILIWE